MNRTEMLVQDREIVLTREMILDCQTEGRSFTKVTMDALGVPYGEPSGWPRRLVGKRIKLSAYERAREGRFMFKGRRGNENPEVQPTLF